MAKAVATVGVSVVARTKNFRKGMKRAQSSLKRFRVSLKRTAIRAAKFGAVLAGVATGAAIIWFKRTMDNIDATAKWADKLGIATEQLIGLQHAAKLSGVNLNTFNMGLQRMTRRLAEAAMGTGEAKAALIELGINAKELSGRGPGAALLAIADAMAKVRNQSDRVRLSFKLFDSEGVALVNLLRLGSKGLREMMKEARELGLVFSRIDARQVEAATDAITRMRAAFQGIANTITIKISPFIAAMSDRITEFAKAFRARAGNFVESAIKRIGTVATSVALVFLDLKRRWLEFSATVMSTIGQLAQGLNTLSGVFLGGQQSGDLLALSMNMKHNAFEARRQAGLMEESMLSTATSFGDMFGNIAKAAREAAEQFVNSMKKLQTGGLFGSLRDALEQLTRQSRVLGGKIGEAVGKSLKEKLAEAGLNFLGLGKGGILTALAGTKSTANATASPAFAATAQQIDLSKVFLGFGSGKKKVQQTSDLKALAMLEKIEGNTKGGTLAVASA